MSTLQFKDPTSGRIITAKAGSDYANRNSANQINNVASKDMIAHNQGKTTVQTQSYNQPTQSFSTPSMSTPNNSYTNSNSYSSPSNSYNSPSQGSSMGNQGSIQNNTSAQNQAYAQQQAQIQAQQQAQLKAQQDAKNKQNYLQAQGGGISSDIQGLASKYGVNSSILNEIKRKADNGIALTGNNAQNAELYKMFQEQRTSTAEANKYAPDVNATANFNNNWDDFSGVLINGEKASHAQATGSNPLHLVNTSRQGLLQTANGSGDYTAYNNFESKQDPLKYDKDANGNFKENKNYYAELLKSADQASKQARMSGDEETARIWEKEAQNLAQKYNSAPGMATYISGVHDSGHGQGSSYGVQDYDKEFFDSVYNQGGTGYVPHENTVAKWMNGTYDQNPEINQWLINNFADGDGLGTYWTNNPVFRDNPDYLTQAMNLSNSYGDADEQAVRQGVNAKAMQNYLDNQNYQIPQIQQPIVQAQPTYQMPMEEEMPMISNPTPSGNASSGNLQHIYAPGASSNTQGYEANQLITNDAFNRYLQNIFKGGF